MGNGENSGECLLVRVTAEEGLTREREGVSGVEEKGLGDSKGAELKKKGVVTGGSRRPVQ